MINFWFCRAYFNNLLMYSKLFYSLISFVVSIANIMTFAELTNSVVEFNTVNVQYQSFYNL